jgi:hypothetical protein
LTTSSTGSKLQEIFFLPRKIKNIKVRINRRRKNKNIGKSITYVGSTRNSLLRVHPQQAIAGGCTKITLICTFL